MDRALIGRLMYQQAVSWRTEMKEPGFADQVNAACTGRPINPQTEDFGLLNHFMDMGHDYGAEPVPVYGPARGRLTASDGYSYDADECAGETTWE